MIRTLTPLPDKMCKWQHNTEITAGMVTVVGESHFPAAWDAFLNMRMQAREDKWLIWQGVIDAKREYVVKAVNGLAN